MACQSLVIHQDNPQLRLIRHVVDTLKGGGVIAYPTDSAYALGCQVGDKAAMERIRRLRDLPKDHNFTLVCKDLREIATYARVDNTVYRFLKAHTPGPYTFILPATREVPRRLQHPKRKTIGLRVPDNPIAACLLEELAEPIMSVTLILPGHELPLSDPYEIEKEIGTDIDLLVDGGNCGFEPTTIVDFVDNQATVLREGKGEWKG